MRIGVGSGRLIALSVYQSRGVTVFHFSLCRLSSPVSVPYLSHGVFAHEPALVDISLYAIDAPFACILPHRDVTVVLQAWLTRSVLGYHYLIVVEHPEEVFVIEIRAGIYERFLLIMLLYQIKELEERVTEGGIRKSLLCLHINHRYEVLLAAQALCGEVPQLCFLRSLGAVEMVRPYFQPMAVGHEDILLVALVDAVSTLCRLDIHVCHTCVLAYRLPEDIALIVAYIYAMDMAARILTFHRIRLCHDIVKG